MNAGFLPLRRSFFVHAFWGERRIFSRAEALLDLIQSAAFQPQKQYIAGKMIEVARGEIVAAVRYLEQRWQWSNTKVGMFLEMLRQDGTITTEKRQGITVILIINYEGFSMAFDTQRVCDQRQKNDGETPCERRNGGKGERSKNETSQQGSKAAKAMDAASPPKLEEVVEYALTAQIPKNVANAYWLDRSKTDPPFTFATGQRVGNWGMDLERYWQHWQEGTQRKESNGRSPNRSQQDHRAAKCDREYSEPEYRPPIVDLDE